MQRGQFPERSRRGAQKASPVIFRLTITKLSSIKFSQLANSSLSQQTLRKIMAFQGWRIGITITVYFNRKSDCWRQTHVTTFGGGRRARHCFCPRLQNPYIVTPLWSHRCRSPVHLPDLLGRHAITRERYEYRLCRD